MHEPRTNMGLIKVFNRINFYVFFLAEKLIFMLAMAQWYSIELNLMLPMLGNIRYGLRYLIELNLMLPIAHAMVLNRILCDDIGSCKAH